MNSCAASIYANIVACMNCLFETISMRTGPLNDVEYIICEINRETPQKKLDYIGSVTIEKIIELLTPYGFILVDQDWAGISWGDGLFIKNK